MTDNSQSDKKPRHVIGEGWLKAIERGNYMRADMKALVKAYRQRVRELAEVKRDAARYRWLREANSIMPGKPRVQPIEWYCGTAADEAIDAAMKEGK